MQRIRNILITILALAGHLNAQVVFTNQRHADTFAIDTVKFSNIQNIDSGRILGRLASGTGDIQLIRLGSGFTKQGDTLLNVTTGSTASYKSITPSQLTSDNNDYNPSGFDSANVIRLDGDSGFRAITSMVSQSDGEQKTFINIGSYAVYFPPEHPSGENQNRIKSSGDIILFPNRSVTFTYDTIADRWFALNYLFHPSEKSVVHDFQPNSTTAGDNSHLVYTAGGAGTVQTFVSANSTIPFGYFNGTTGTTAGGGNGVSIGKSGTSVAYFGNTHIIMEGTLVVPALSTGTDSFTVSCSVTSTGTSTSANVNNSIGIKYSHGLNGGSWTAFSRDNAGSESQLDLSSTVTAGAVNFLKIEINKGCTEARFYVNGTYKGRITGNMPNATGCGPRIGIYKGVGINSVAINVPRIAIRIIAP